MKIQAMSNSTKSDVDRSIAFLLNIVTATLMRVSKKIAHPDWPAKSSTRLK